MQPTALIVPARYLAPDFPISLGNMGAAFCPTVSWHGKRPGRFVRRAQSVADSLLRFVLAGRQLTLSRIVLMNCPARLDESDGVNPSEMEKHYAGRKTPDQASHPARGERGKGGVFRGVAPGYGGYAPAGLRTAPPGANPWTRSHRFSLLEAAEELNKLHEVLK